MAEQFESTAGLILEIETKDATLSSHSGRLIWYVPPTAEGKQGDISTALSVPGTAVAGLNGLSVNQGTPITLQPGPLRYWSESSNAAGIPCVSPASEIIVDPRGFVRR